MLASLRDRLALVCRVRRDGGATQVPAHALVAGDVVELSAGNRVPADGVLLEARDLLLDESSLSGESFPVEKQPGVSAIDAALGACRQRLPRQLGAQRHRADAGRRHRAGDGLRRGRQDHPADRRPFLHVVPLGPAGPAGHSLPVFQIGFVLTIVAAVLTMISAVSYLRAAWPDLRGHS